MRMSRSRAGSSFGSCLTSWPRMARFTELYDGAGLSGSNGQLTAEDDQVQNEHAYLANLSRSRYRDDEKKPQSTSCAAPPALSWLLLSRSHKAITSSTLVTIRCCSDRGGNGTGNSSICCRLMLGNAMPLPIAMIAARCRHMKRRTYRSAKKGRIAATPRPIHARNPAMFVRPVVEPRTQTRDLLLA